MTIRFERIHAAYHRRAPVLAGVTGAIPAGAVTAIVGPNGAGKSTLLRVLTGALRPSAGEATLNGTDTPDLDLLRAHPRDRARRLAYIPQTGGPSFDFSVREVVRLGRFAGRGPADESAVADALARVDLTTEAERPFAELSVGQRQRAGVARALAQLSLAPTHAARGVLADEPVAAMDPRHAVETLTILRDLSREGCAVAVVLHDLSAAARFADRALVLAEGGRSVDEGPVDEVLAPDRLEALFGLAFARGSVGGAPVVAPVVSPVAAG